MDGLGTAKEKRLELLGTGEVYSYTMLLKRLGTADHYHDQGAPAQSTARATAKNAKLNAQCGMASIMGANQRQAQTSNRRLAQRRVCRGCPLFSIEARLWKRLANPSPDGFTTRLPWRHLTSWTHEQHANGRCVLLLAPLGWAGRHSIIWGRFRGEACILCVAAC